MADDELSTDDLDAMLKRITECDNTLDGELKSLQDDSGDAQKVAAGDGLKPGLDEARKARA